MQRENKKMREMIKSIDNKLIKSKHSYFNREFSSNDLLNSSMASNKIINNNNNTSELSSILVKI